MRVWVSEREGVSAGYSVWGKNRNIFLHGSKCFYYCKIVFFYTQKQVFYCINCLSRSKSSIWNDTSCLTVTTLAATVTVCKSMDSIQDTFETGLFIKSIVLQTDARPFHTCGFTAWRKGMELCLLASTICMCFSFMYAVEGPTFWRFPNHTYRASAHIICKLCSNLRITLWMFSGRVNECIFTAVLHAFILCMFVVWKELFQTEQAR